MIGRGFRYPILGAHDLSGDLLRQGRIHGQHTRDELTRKATMMSRAFYHTPPKPVSTRVLCPVCHEMVYSRAGIHPQCAVQKVESQTAIPAGTNLLGEGDPQHVICELVPATNKVFPLYTIDAARAVNLMEFVVYIAKELLLTAT